MSFMKPQSSIWKAAALFVALGVGGGLMMSPPHPEAAAAAPRVTMRVGDGLEVASITVVTEAGAPVPVVQPNRRYRLRVKLRNNTPADWKGLPTIAHPGRYYDHVQVRVLPKSAGIVFYQDDTFKKTATRFNSPRIELSPQKEQQFEIPFEFTSAKTLTRGLRFGVGLYAQEAPAVSAWRNLAPKF